MKAHGSCARNSFNTLVSTCIGEQGLDIPEVCLGLGMAFGTIKALRSCGCYSMLVATCIREGGHPRSAFRIM